MGFWGETSFLVGGGWDFGVKLHFWEARDGIFGAKSHFRRGGWDFWG